MKSKINKPVDLLVANVMHEAAQGEVAVRSLIDTLCGPDKTENYKILDSLNEVIARQILNEVANKASLATVLAALAAVKAPSSLELIGEGLQAIKDRQG